MSEEVLAESLPVPASDETASTEVAVTTPETPEVAPKTFSQEELDAAIGKRLAREQRKWERERQVAPAAPVDIPPVDQFDSVEAYVEARAVKLIEQREQQRQQSDILESYHEREEEARGKYDDFEQVAYNPKLTITNAMAETIQFSDIGPELAYYLGSNPKDAERISRMSPLGQAKEIGKIEAKLVSEPPVKRTTSAPQPISPVTARSAGSSSHDTTDPRSAQNMTASQWIEADRARQRKNLEAQRNR